ADITWGEETHRFTREQLAAGINLPEHFRQTPFDAAFANLMKAIMVQQERERAMIKAAGDATAPKAGWTAADVATRDALDTASHAAVVPVTHTIVIAPVR
ncbi:MAG TPA: lipolytic enzyme, partial [Planctomycetota bacterium]|nr:lipolytic enzyme [Planctomycetota bacterium]